MKKILTVVAVLVAIAIGLFLATFEVEGFFNGIVGPGEKISRFYRLREMKKVDKKIQTLRASSDQNADLEITKMIESGEIDGINLLPALHALGEKRSLRSVDTIIRAMRANERSGEIGIIQVGAEALGKIGGDRAREELERYYGSATNSSDPLYWRLRVLDTDKALRKALDDIASPNQAL